MLNGSGGQALAVVRDLSARRAPASAEEVEAFEVDVLAGFVLARASAGLSDSTIRSDVGHLEQLRTWFGQPLWEMQPEDADAYLAAFFEGEGGDDEVGDWVDSRPPTMHDACHILSRLLLQSVVISCRYVLMADPHELHFS